MDRRVAFVALGLTVAGIAVATYLTIAHYTTSAVLACSDKGFVNCAQVTTSQWSEIAGIPVALLGLAYFVAMVPLNLPAAWRSPDPRIHQARLALAVVGMAFVLWLVYAEFVLIRAICLYCTVVHVLTFALFVLVVLTWNQVRQGPLPRRAGGGATGARGRPARSRPRR